MAMSETLFRFLLSEMKTLRITCKNCKAAAEAPLEKLAARDAPMRCPVCGEYFTGPAADEGNA
jgi:predicted Zn finger-like uncharacterized protein